jgi:AP endonuclease-1
MQTDAVVAKVAEKKTAAKKAEPTEKPAPAAKKVTAAEAKKAAAVIAAEEPDTTAAKKKPSPKVGVKRAPADAAEAAAAKAVKKEAKAPGKKKQADDTPAPAAKEDGVAVAASEDAAPSPPKRGTSATGSGSGIKVTEESVIEGTVPFQRKSTDADFDPKSMIKVISWNVASLRALLRKGDVLGDLIKAESPDVLCLQETKLNDWEEAKTLGAIPGYTFTDSISVAKKGYSGTRTYVKKSIADASGFAHAYGFDPTAPDTHDTEGRIITTTLPAEAGGIAIINSYVPNSGLTLDRLDYRVDSYDPMVRAYLGALQKKQGGSGVVWTGDLNVAERDYDRFWSTSWRQMQQSPGFTPQERASFRTTLAATGMVDAFRHLYPNARNAYTFYSARFNMRARGNGWRLDYYVTSAPLLSRVVDIFPLPLDKWTQSDHQPLVMWLRRR